MEDKIYFMPRDLVTIRQAIPYKPVMYVVRKETFIIKPKDGEKDGLRGIRCRWFTTDGLIQEAIFNTKDLVHYTIENEY